MGSPRTSSSGVVRRAVAVVAVAGLLALQGCALLSGATPAGPAAASGESASSSSSSSSSSSLAAGEDEAGVPASRPVGRGAAANGRAPLGPPKIDPFDPRTIPGGLVCLIRLKELGVEHASIPALRGVDTPVRIGGTIGGIRYRALGKQPLLCDCRLALALHRAAPLLRNMGVTELRFSSAYRYSLMPSGRLSQHAMGLALDVHKVGVGSELHVVEDDFTLGMEDGCAGPPLNRMACLLKVWGLFDWVLTPDFDFAHRNHFHLDIYDLHRRRFVPREQPGVAIDD